MIATRSTKRVMATPQMSQRYPIDRKIQIAEYFIAQLYLTSDLCLDRNYVAIGLLENVFPYEVLLSIVGNNTIPNRFKAPAYRLIRCLFVDREPHVTFCYMYLMILFSFFKCMYIYRSIQLFLD